MPTIDDVLDKACSVFGFKTEDEILSWLNRPQYGPTVPKLSALRMMLTPANRALLFNMLVNFDHNHEPEPLPPLIA